MTHTQNTYLWK